MNDSSGQQQMRAWSAVFNKVCDLHGGYSALDAKYPRENGREMILRGIQELADAREPGWIDVKDRLPGDEDGIEVVFYSPRSGYPANTFIGVYLADDGWFSCGIHITNVTHWKRKPLPPQ